jgi:hypothetical protein
MSPLAGQQVSSMRRLFLLGIAGLVGAGLAVSIVLWAKYGTAIFFESIRNGLANCFG